MSKDKLFAAAIDMKDDDIREAMAEIAPMAYANEPCRICGGNIDEQQVREAVFAGYSADCTSRIAHADCWASHPPVDQWVKQ